MLIGPRCFPDMADISHYRERANHLRQLAERTCQDDLEALLRSVASAKLIEIASLSTRARRMASSPAHSGAIPSSPSDAGRIEQ